jgi:metal-responsive CopG/Arc/MetJ family transcriptional regulator
MKTIAISIEEELLGRVDRLARARRSSPGGGRTRGRRPNRSEVIRDAVREFVLRQHRQQEEARDREVLATHRRRLSRQLEALVPEQDDQ